MALATTARPDRAPTARRVVLKASRPALIDLRFKGDAWVVDRGSLAAVCLGDFPLGHVAVSPFDVPSLNRTFGQVRTGQARRYYARRLCRLP
jgi:hypothetical protein